MPNSTGTSVGLVLAAGLSTRFGGDKLLRDLGGRPLGAHIADTLADLDLSHRLAVCPAGNAARAALFAGRGFKVIDNPEPALGMGVSLALGAARAIELDADVLLVCLADMPAVTASHLQAVLAAVAGSACVATEAAGTRSPPVAFSRQLLPQLLKLDGDRGARDLLRGATTIPASPALVRDYDTEADFGA